MFHVLGVAFFVKTIVIFCLLVVETCDCFYQQLNEKKLYSVGYQLFCLPFYLNLILRVGRSIGEVTRNKLYKLICELN